jgi:hypothetical protein
MSVMGRTMTVLAAGTWAAFVLPQAPAQTAPPATESVAPVVMRWIDLRDNNPGTAPYRDLWSDRLDSATRRWKATSPRGKPLPAYTLAHVFANADTRVLVSILFTMYDCELPGNGPGADLYARCPLRVVSGAPGQTKVTNVAQACHLYVPTSTNAADGPDRQRNRTTVTLDRNGILRLRVTQFGRPVPSCDLDLKLE